MSKRYDEIMDKIVVTPEMRERVLRNISHSYSPPAHSSKVIHLKALKRYLPLVACLAIVLVGTLAIPSILRMQQEQPPVVMQPNGIVELGSAEELSETIGFETAAPEALPFAVEKTLYIAYWETLAEIRCIGEGKTSILRKSVGNEDNSGDFNSYNDSTRVVVDDKEILLKGNGGSYSLAVWQDAGFSYSLRLSDALGRDEMLGIIETVK